MPHFSKKSLYNLKTCDENIQKIIFRAIKMVDFSVICGHRSKEKQFELFKRGRDQDLNIIDSKKVVTYCDGTIKKSNHNFYLSKAVDIIPYPTKHKDVNEFYYLAGVILAISNFYNINLKWGGHWTTFKDYPHFELM